MESAPEETIEFWRNKGSELYWVSFYSTDVYHVMMSHTRQFHSLFMSHLLPPATEVEQPEPRLSICPDDPAGLAASNGTSATANESRPNVVEEFTVLKASPPTAGVWSRAGAESSRGEGLKC